MANVIKTRHRLSLDLDSAAKARLEELTIATRSGSMTQTINRALSLLELVTERQQKGGKLILRDGEDGTEETIRIL